MIPVLATRDPEGAARQLTQVFGFEERAPGRLRLGDQEIALCDPDARPAGLVELPLDHLALSVDSADRAMRELKARGGELDPGFTPEGPVDIPEFWSEGVRFVFFKGPAGAPLEFCQQHGIEAAPGHSHYGLRTSRLDEVEGRLAQGGATRVAAHVLDGQPPVDVRFLEAEGRIYELFNQPRGGSPDGRAEGWIGFVEE